MNMTQKQAAALSQLDQVTSFFVRSFTGPAEMIKAKAEELRPGTPGEGVYAGHTIARASTKDLGSEGAELTIHYFLDPARAHEACPAKMAAEYNRRKRGNLSGGKDQQ